MFKELVFPKDITPLKIGDYVYHNGSLAKILAYYATSELYDKLFVKGYTIETTKEAGHAADLYSYNEYGEKVSFPQNNAWYALFRNCSASEFTVLKESLKDFDAVVLRNGHKMYKYSHAFIATDEKDPLIFINLNLYNNNLECSSDSRKDVMQVWRPKSTTKVNEFLNVMRNTSGNCDMNEYFNLQWQRKETVEITMDDIAKKFGIPVEQLKIKK